MMNDTIIGVVIGGVIASFGTLISIWFRHKQWKAEQKIKVLERKRNKFETLSIKTLESLNDGMNNNNYSSDMTSNILILFPKNVSKKFIDFIHKKDTTEKDGKIFFLDISVEIKKITENIDKKIDEILK